MIKVFVVTRLGERCFKFDFHSEALSFVDKIGALVNCDITVYNGEEVVNRQSWYNGYKQFGA